MVSGDITKDSTSKSTFDSCVVCCLRIKDNSALCGKWIHGRCARMKRVTPKCEQNSTCKEFKGNNWNWRLKRTWKKQVKEESVKVGLRREDALF